MKTSTLISNEKIYSRFLWSKSEVACTIKSKETLTCDLCGKQISWDKTVNIGLYTGQMTWEREPPGILELHWGHKRNKLDVCDTHTELEIDEKVDQLKALEKKKD